MCALVKYSIVNVLLLGTVTIVNLNKKTIEINLLILLSFVANRVNIFGEGIRQFYYFRIITFRYGNKNKNNKTIVILTHLLFFFIVSRSGTVFIKYTYLPIVV